MLHTHTHTNEATRKWVPACAIIHLLGTVKLALWDVNVSKDAMFYAFAELAKGLTWTGKMRLTSEDAPRNYTISRTNEQSLKLFRLKR